MITIIVNKVAKFSNALNDTIAKKVEVTVRALESLQAEDGTEITMEDGSTFEI